MQLKDRIALITGASSGIGEAIAKSLAKEKATVILASRGLKKLKKIEAEIKKSQGKAYAYAADIAQAPKVNMLVGEIIRKFGQINILVNCAGMVSWNSVEKESYENYYMNMEANFYGTLHMCKEVLPYMLKQKSGKIINFSSGKGKKGGKNASAYAASKFAVTGFSQCLREEVREKGIQVFTICPGKVDTPIHDLDKNAPPRESMLKVDDINDLVLYLLKTSSRVKLEDIEIRSNALG